MKNSPYKDGQGDIVREFADACRAEGMKMGLYLSPWDRNRADYGKPEYIEYYRNQLRELLTGYGDVFEVWFDGANGGDGWYGGANETRTIDRNTYYDWPGTWQVVRELQPGAVMFSDGGPDVRWVGNEKGFAGETNWSLLKRADFAPGAADREALNVGQEDGTHWLPAEVDVSIRPGWYYHEAEDSLVRTVPQLLDIYYASVGRNASMLLNVPPDKTGRIPAVDSLRLMEFVRALAAEFSKDLAADARVSASNVRGHSGKYGAMRVTDGDTATYWATDDDVRNASLTVMFDQPTVFNRLLVQEYIPLGQRVRKFRVEGADCRRMADACRRDDHRLQTHSAPADRDGQRGAADRRRSEGLPADFESATVLRAGCSGELRRYRCGSSRRRSLGECGIVTLSRIRRQPCICAAGDRYKGNGCGGARSLRPGVEFICGPDGGSWEFAKKR